MAEEAAEVRVRLALEDGAAHAAAEHFGAAVERARHHTEAGSKSVDMWGHAFIKLKDRAQDYSRDVARGIITGEIALRAMEKAWDSVGEATHKAHELAREAFDAALKEGKEIKEMAASLSMVAPEASLARIKGVARVVHEEMEDLGISAGVASDDVQAAFNQIAARSQKSVEELGKLTEQMVYAGRVVPGGIGALSSGFTMFEQGMIRARNPIVMLIAQTGVLKGNAHQVAHDLMKMTPEKQLQLGEQAIAKMADKAAKLPLSFNAMKTSLMNLKENVLETAGRPIVEAVTKVMGDVRAFFLAHRDQIEEVAHRIGSTIGNFITQGQAFVRDFVGYFSGTDTQIGEDIKAAWEYAADVMQDIMENGRAFAATLNDMWKLGKDVANALTAGAEFREGKRRMTSEERQESARKLAMSTGTIAQVKEETKHPLDEASEKMLKRANRASKDTHLTVDEMNKSIGKFYEAYRAAGASNKELDEYAQGFQRSFNEAHKTNATTFDYLKDMAATNPMQAADAFAKAYSAAAAQNDRTMTSYAEKLFAGSKELQKAFDDSGFIIETGMGDMLGHLKNMAGMDKSIWASMSSRFKSLGEAGKAPHVNFNGGQTFNIKQDFRDQDPDRIAIIFRNDILRAATSKVGASTSVPLGA